MLYIAANPRRLILEKCFKSCFDSGFRIYAKTCRTAPESSILAFWCIMRRVMAILLKETNFGPNVIYVAGISICDKID